MKRQPKPSKKVIDALVSVRKEMLLAVEEIDAMLARIGTDAH